MKNIKSITPRTALAALLLTCSANASVTILEDFQFDDAVGTTLSAATNSAGTASFANAANAVTNGAGSLAITVGTDGTDNIFRNAALTTSGVTTGTFELSFTIAAASIADGDAAGANVGFGIRDSGTNTDLFLVRLHRQNSTLRLQTRIGTTSSNLVDFGSTTVSKLDVRAVFDLDADTMDVFWNEDSVTAGSSTDIAINDGSMDILRLASNTNTTDWGAADTATVDSLALCAVPVPEPSSSLLLSLCGLSVIARRRR